MRLCRLLPLFCAAALCLAAGCGKPPEPPRSHAEVAKQWWQAVVAGDAAGAASHLSGDFARRQSTLVFDECARVGKAAGEGDRLAAGMLERLKGIRIGEVRSGSEREVVPLVLSDGKPFLSVTLEPCGDRWAIVDIRQGDGDRR